MDFRHHVESIPSKFNIRNGSVRTAALLVEVGLLPADLFRLAGPDQGRTNAARFERLWGEERESCDQWNRQHADTQAAVSQSQYRTELHIFGHTHLCS